METDRIRFSALGRRTPFFRAPDLTSADHPWAGFSFEEASGPNEPLPSHAWSKTTLLYVTDGLASLRWKHGGVWNADALEPGTVSIIRRDAEIQSAAPDGAIRMMVLQLDASRLESLAPAEILAIERSLGSAQVTQDAQLAALLSAMRAEVRGGCGSGRLYGESVSTALLAYLAARYAAHTGAGSDKRLSPAEMRRLIAYIRENLSEDVSVAGLAALVRLSPSHFARVFKAAFGMTPYRCVMGERVTRAKSLLAGKTLSAGHVAAEVGFASQSHFAKVFRQFTGVTPKRYRAGL